MLPKLQGLFDRVEMQRQKLLRQAEGLNKAQLAFQPAAGEWSLLEHLHHLTLTDQEIIRQASHPKAVLRLAKQQERRVPFGIVWLVLRSGIRVPVPIDSVLPTPGQTLLSVSAQWDEARGQMRQILGALNEEQARQPFAMHPVSGPLTPAQVLRFTLAHGHYHLRRMRHIRHAPAFPKQQGVG